MAWAFGLDQFSLIGISGGTPYVLATLLKLASRVRTATILSGMGPIGLPGALRGDATLASAGRRDRLEGAEARPPTLPRLGRPIPGGPLAIPRPVHRGGVADPTACSSGGRPLYETFLRDMHEVFEAGQGPESLAQELRLYRNHGFSMADLPEGRCVTLWQGLDDDVVPPSMAYAMLRTLPDREGHFVPGGHFVAASIADRIIDRLVEQLESQKSAT